MGGGFGDFASFLESLGKFGKKPREFWKKQEKSPQEGTKITKPQIAQTNTDYFTTKGTEKHEGKNKLMVFKGILPLKFVCLPFP
jgi:hypothetical protein